MRTRRSGANIERRKQRQVVVDRVHVPYTDSHKVSVNAGARLRLVAHAVGGNASLRALIRA